MARTTVIEVIERGPRGPGGEVSDAQLATAVSALTTALAAKQDAGTAATDAELGAAVASLTEAITLAGALAQEWEADEEWAAGTPVTYRGVLYTAIEDIPSKSTFDVADWIDVGATRATAMRDLLSMDLICERVVESDATSNRYMEVIGRSPGVNGSGLPSRLYGVGQSRNLHISTDNGLTWPTASYSVGSPATIEQVLELSNGTVLIAVSPDSSSAQEIRRSTDGGTTFTTVYTFTAPVNGGILHSRSWMEDTLRPGGGNGIVFMAEYGEGRGETMNLLRSTDYGANWTSVHQWTDIRHLHLVQRDPYEPTRLYVGSGDLADESRLMYSLNDGTSFTTIVNGAASGINYNKARQTALAFLDDAIIWGTDNNLVEGKVAMYRLPRENLLLPNGNPDNTPSIETVSLGLTNAVRGVVVVPNFGIVGWTQAVTPRDWVDFIVSRDGRAWSVVDRWPRRRDVSTDALPKSFTDPDSNGGFWVRYVNLEGAESVGTGRLSLYLKPRPRRLSDRHYPAMHSRYREAGARPDFTEYRATIAGTLDSSAATNTDITLHPRMPADFILTDAYLIHDGADFAADGSNYFTLTVRRRTSAAAVSGAIATWGGANVALAGKTPIQRTATTANRGLAGEALILRATKSGTPATSLINATVVICIRYVNPSAMR